MDNDTPPETKPVSNDSMPLQDHLTTLEQENRLLKQQLQRQSAYMLASNEITLIVDEQGKFVDFVALSEQSLYRKPKEFIDKSIFDIFPHDLCQNFIQVMQQVIANNQPMTIEYSLQEADGERWYRARCAPIESLDDDVAWVVLTPRDITAQKRDQALIKSNQERLQLISLFISDIIYQSSMDPDDRIFVDWSYGAVEEITGYTEEEINALPENWVTIVHPDDMPIFSYEKQPKIVGHPSSDEVPIHQIEYRIIHRDGSIRWLRDTSQEQSELNTPEKRVFLGACKDITSEIETRHALMTSEQRFRNLTEKPAVGIIETLSDGTILYINPALVSMLEYPSLDYVHRHNRSIDFYTNAEDRDYVVGALDESGILTNYPISVTTYKGQTKHLLVNGKKIEEGHYLSSLADVTELYLKEKELLNYRTMVSVSLDAMALISTDFRYLIVNQTHLNLWRMSSSDIVGKFITDIMPESMFHEVVEPRMRRAFAGETVTYEEWFNLPSGQYYFSASYTPVYDDHGETNGLVMRAHDITKIKQAEERLQHYQTLTSNTQDIMALLNKEYQYITCNPAYAQYWGKEQSEVIGSYANNIVDPDLLNTTIKTRINKVLEGDSIRYQEWRDFPIGRRYMDISYTPIYDDKQEIFGFTVVGRDITNIYESEMLARNVLMTAYAGYWLSDVHGKLLDVNQSLCDILGYTREELLTMSIADFEFQETPTQQVALIEQLLETGADRFITQHRRKDGKIIDVEVSVTCQKLPELRLIVFTRDITKKIQAEARIRTTMNELERSNQRLQQFAYIASHDLQEPLRMVTNYLQFIERRYNDLLDDKGKLFIKFATDGAKRMNSLINDLLEFSRVSTRGQPLQTTSMQTCFDIAYDNLQLRIAQSGATIDCAPLPDEVLVDEIQMVQVWQNLLTNALKFRKPDVPIHIVVDCQKVVQSNEQPMEEWQFSLKDNGIGIAPEFHQQIFTIFRRLHTKAEYEGTGIGLAVCERIIERHQGKIWVESKEGYGATFYFTLPTGAHESRSANESYNQ